MSATSAAAEIDSLKGELQQIFSDGLVVIVGSGVSAAEGIPGMGALEVHLNAQVPKLVTGDDLECWKAIAVELAKKVGLEAALLTVAPTDALEDVILGLTADLIESAETRILEEVITGKRILPLSKLLPHLNPQPNRALPVITPNYERLIEAAAEIIGWGVDSMFIGNTLGRFDQQISQRSFLKEVQIKSKRAIYTYRNRIALAKPHGSLDWYQHADGPVRCSIKLPLPKLIITPGRNKYHRGYAIPFDRHRELGNTAIDHAARLLILGYGFNDDHLETHLSQSLRRGKPALILTRSLSGNATKVIAQSPNAIALSENPAVTTGVTVTRQSGRVEHKFAPIWQVSTFVDIILNP